MRAFFCLELEAPLQQEIDKITHTLCKTRVKASWVKPENLHITVRFLGEIPETLLPKLEAAGHDALQQSEVQNAIECGLDRLGAFPSIEQPRVVWVGCSREPEAVQRLAAHLQDQLELLGFAPERGHFVTHITLGRVKEGGQRVQALTQALNSMKRFSYPAQVSDLTLMASQLTSQGAIYKPIFRLPFSA